MIRAISSRRFIVVAGCALFFYTVVISAWLCDDAYITFRTVDNFVHGYGLRWNVLERVQAFTHPAWLLLFTPFYALTREVFFTALALQATLATAFAAILLGRVAQTATAAFLGAAVIVSSKALVDFSTSGLENPLTFLLLVCFFIEWRRVHLNRNLRITRLFLLASLLLLCRLDLVLLVAPALIVAIPQRQSGAIKAAVLGALPVLLWEALSFVYYGQLIPNTALAKIPPGVPVRDLLGQGLRYWQATTLIDPITPTALIAALGWLLIGAGASGRWLAAGITLYLLYLLFVGGDFMSGRFFTPPLVLAVSGVIGLRSTPPRVFGAIALVIVIGGLLAPFSPLLSGPAFGSDLNRDAELGYFGVADERRFYYPALGLLRRLRVSEPPAPNPWLSAGESARLRGGDLVIAASNVGLFGFAAGPMVHVLDRNGLADPLLARLPPKSPWRVGHFTRDIPDGYVETLRLRTNVIRDPGIRALYENIQLVTQKAIWRRDRFRAIILLQFGTHNIGRSASLASD